MIDSYLSELRRIRITLVILTIIIAFTSGNRADDHVVTVDHNGDSAMNTPQYSNSIMVPLENGHFGILSGNANNGEVEKIKILFYDQATNQISFKKEIAVMEIFEGMNPK
jgi:hypothetical protein